MSVTLGLRSKRCMEICFGKSGPGGARQSLGRVARESVFASIHVVET